MQQSETIAAIETFIRNNGDRFKLYYIKHGEKGELLPFKKISDIEQQYGSLSQYIRGFIENYTPESIEVITKKPNGNSSGKLPKSRIIHLSENKMQQGETNSNNWQQPLSLSGVGLSGVEKIHSLETTLLNRELQKETNRAERYENLYNNLREEHFKLKKDYDLLSDKTALEREKERLKNENSLSAVIKEVKPELFGLLGNLTGNTAPQQGALEGVESGKIGVLTGTLTQLPEEIQSEAIEVLIRYLNTDATQRGKVLGSLRTMTETLNEQIAEILAE